MPKLLNRFYIFFLFSFIYLLFAFSVSAQTSSDWPMAGANPERTGWSTEEVSGKLVPAWYKIFNNVYILPRTQVIAVNNTLFIATAKGLYAIDSESGSEKWVYPTELPLADSPTVVNGVAYIGGFDRKMHAVNISNGARSWTFTAEAGFQVSPLVVNNTVYAGNRDSFFYALDATSGSLKWKYKTGGPIVYSAAYKDGVIYFASNDSYAYALNENGSLKWKSQKLPGAGFHSWWPVIVGNYVIFSGSENYRWVGAGGALNNQLDRADIYPAGMTEGTLVGPTVSGQTWAHGATVIDLSKPNQGTTPVTEYFEAKPYRRTFFVLDKITGIEKTYDFDNDGKKEYAPILWFGSHSGNRFPPVIGSDGIVYVSNDLWSNNTIPRGQISGWKIDTPYVSLPEQGKNAVDEPQGYSAGGGLIYWARCCDRVGSAFDYLNPGTSYKYFGYDLYNKVLPGYNTQYWNPDSDYTSPFAAYGAGGKNSVYGFHGDTQPPTPYKGKVYFIKSNALIAFAPSGNGTKLTDATTKPTAATDMIPSKESIRQKLESEIKKMIEAGHLRTGYHTTGIWDLNVQSRCGPSLQKANLTDYFHQPADTIYTLSIAISHLTGTLKDQAINYLKSEFQAYPPYSVTHIGWGGAARETFIIPDDVASSYSSSSPSTGSTIHPFAFYAMWKYAAATGDTSFFNTAKSKFPATSSDSELIEFAWLHNAFIAGLRGYMELEKMTGTISAITSSPKYSEYQRLLTLRSQNFSKDSPWQNESFNSTAKKGYCRAQNAMRNFFYMTPELGEYLKTNALSKVQDTLNEYYKVTPYWFVSKVETAFGEGVLHHLYDYPSIFSAKAHVLQEPYPELAKYIDVPAFEKGDLFYIQNLVYALSASGTGPTAPPVTNPPGGKPGDANNDNKVDGLDYVIWLNNYNKSVTSGAASGDFDGNGKVDGLDYVIWLNNYLA